MKFILLGVIELYWFLVPKSKRRRCIFKKSCSNHVYETAKNHGFVNGLKAFCFRFKNCRRNIQIFRNQTDNSILILLPSKVIIESDAIAENIINQYNS